MKDESHVCFRCGNTTSNLRRHMRESHGIEFGRRQNIVSCFWCPTNWRTLEDLRRHIIARHQDPPSSPLMSAPAPTPITQMPAPTAKPAPTEITLPAPVGTPAPEPDLWGDDDTIFLTMDIDSMSVRHPPSPPPSVQPVHVPVIQYARASLDRKRRKADNLLPGCSKWTSTQVRENNKRLKTAAVHLRRKFTYTPSPSSTPPSSPPRTPTPLPILVPVWPPHPNTSTPPPPSAPRSPPPASLPLVRPTAIVLPQCQPSQLPSTPPPPPQPIVVITIGDNDEVVRQYEIPEGTPLNIPLQDLLVLPPHQTPPPDSQEEEVPPAQQEVPLHIEEPPAPQEILPPEEEPSASAPYSPSIIIIDDDEEQIIPAPEASELSPQPPLEESSVVTIVSSEADEGNEQKTDGEEGEEDDDDGEEADEDDDDDDGDGGKEEDGDGGEDSGEEGGEEEDAADDGEEEDSEDDSEEESEDDNDSDEDWEPDKRQQSGWGCRNDGPGNESSQSDSNAPLTDNGNGSVSVAHSNSIGDSNTSTQGSFTIAELRDKLNKMLNTPGSGDSNALPVRRITIAGLREQLQAKLTTPNHSTGPSTPSNDLPYNPSDPSSPSSSSPSSGRSTPTNDRPNNPLPIAIPYLVVEGFEEFETAFRGRLKTYRMVDAGVATARLTIPEYLVEIYERIVNLLRQVLRFVNAVKVNIWMDCEFTNVHGETCRRAFKTRNEVVLRSTDIEDLCGRLFQKILDEKETCEMKGSGWAFFKIVDFQIRVNVYEPLRGAAHVFLPEDIAARRAVINVINADDQCFKYAILSRYLDDHRPVNVTPEDLEEEGDFGLDFSQLTYPVTLADINAFERLNGVSVNVYGIERAKSRFRAMTQGAPRYYNKVYPLRVTKSEQPPEDHFDLLYLTDERTTHYAYIRDFERLVRPQLTRRTSSISVCRRCFAHFDNRRLVDGKNGAQRLVEHRRYCEEIPALRTDVTDKEYIEFERPERTKRARFTIYADFECALVPTDDHGRPVEPMPPPTIPNPPDDPANTHPGLPHHRHHRGDIPESPNVTTRRIHKPYAYAYYVCDSEQGPHAFNRFRSFRGEDAARHFMQQLRQDVHQIGRILYAYRRLRPNLNARELAAYHAATQCYLCGGLFEQRGCMRKVRDHEHAAPYRYLGAAHSKCNLRRKEQDVVNCYFHNLSNYDAHFVVRELGLDTGDVSVIANTEEKYISFTKRFHMPGVGRHEGIAVRFVDSYRFLAKSLAGLVSILPEDRFHITRSFVPDRRQFELLRRKGVFPYEYVTSLTVLDDTERLPPRRAFYDSLRMEYISEDDYTHARRVWNAFECSTLGDYADVYLKTDVMLLTDVFEAFREDCMRYYQLDPAYYVTLPSYAWDVMLRYTHARLETLKDVDMYQFFERGIRGGITQCVHRHAVADNKFTRGEVESPGRDTDSFIMYYDANNLYGYSMTQPLPYGGFAWLSREEMDAMDVNAVGDEDDEGYVLEVDLEYPPELQTRHRDMPYLAETRKAPVDLLPFDPDIVRSFGLGRSKKLMLTVMDKQRYVIHYRLLKQALAAGLHLVRIHRGVRFRQSRWLRPYVLLNAELRRLASNDFEVELFKLMVNAVYGMTLMNVRKHINVKLVTNPHSYLKYVAKSNFGDRTWYDENLALLYMHKTHVVLDRPIYVGMVVLDHSKWWMYHFHYEMVNRYGTDRLRLLYQDTDSLMYLIRTPDVYHDMAQHSEDFDTSNYPRGHPLRNTVNARRLGKFKDEAGGKIIHEFIGLMAKLYCFKYVERPDGPPAPPPCKRAKGVNRAVVARGLTVDDYRRCLEQQTVKITENLRFQSLYHRVFTTSVSKRSLTPFDDKRYIEAGGVSTLPWGHSLIPDPRPPSPQPHDD